MVFDAGPLINLSNRCLLKVLDYLRDEKYITPTVYKEVYLHPLKTRFYSWSAVNIGEIIGKKVKMRTLDAYERALVEEFMDQINNIYYTSKGPVQIVQQGEIEALVVAVQENGIFVTDERTVRNIVEDGETIRKRLESKLKRWVKIDRSRLEYVQSKLEKVFIVRSVDLVAYAYEKGFFEHFKDPLQALRSALYALKYGGCAVSEWEIEAFLKTL